MEIIHDRRSGFDRRHRFLNGLDRRMSPPPPFASAEELDDALGIVRMRDTQPVDHGTDYRLLGAGRGRAAGRMSALRCGCLRAPLV